MPEETVTLELLARLIRNVQSEMAEFRDQMHQRTEQRLWSLEEDRR